MSDPLHQLIGQMTLAELASKTDRTIDQLVGYAFGDAVAAPTSTRSQAKKRTIESNGSGNHPNTRTQEGRAAYERSVYEFVAKAKQGVSAADIRAKVGGTALQARAVLKRLIEQGRITYRGQTRATKYSVAR